MKNETPSSSRLPPSWTDPLTAVPEPSVLFLLGTGLVLLLATRWACRGGE
ncbi:MAG: PEP-CTERM sorting domain-containing protein [Nitrospira sp.]|nr:PEP-CTERM sorting domain-containing protein [Nitrospira sp.]